MPIVTTAPCETTTRVAFSTVSDWYDKKTTLKYGDRSVAAVDALELRDPLHPFAWSPIGKQMLFRVPYVNVGNDEWVDARLLTVQE